MKLRVALVCDAHEFAGAEHYAAVLADELRADVELVAVIPGPAPDEMEARFTAAGARVRRVPGLSRIPTRRSVEALRRVLRDEDPALVHVNMTDQGDALGPLLAARLARRPAVGVLHNVIPDRAAWREAVSRVALRLPARVIAVSEPVGSYARRGGVGVTVVQNGLPQVRALDDARARLGLDAGAFVVGGIGRLHDQKAWDVLMEAAADVRAARPDIRFVVLGEGPERAALERHAAAEHVTLAGYVQDASSYAGAFDVLAVPSRYEAFGLVALEAMQLSVPVVAAAVGGLPDVVGDAGLLVPPEDPAALAGAILRLAREPDLRRELGRRGTIRARERFGSDRMARETLDVYEGVLRG